MLAAVDMTLPSNKGLSEHYKIPGYPTLIYIENGKQTPFSGQRNKVEFGQKNSFLNLDL